MPREKGNWSAKDMQIRGGRAGDTTYKQRAFKHYEMCEQALPGHANAVKWKTAMAL